MLNKALLMACGGKKGPDLGELYSRFSMTVTDIDGIFGAEVYNGVNTGEYTHIEGTELVGDHSFANESFYCYEINGGTLVLTPGEWDFGSDLQYRTCAILNENTGVITYGFWGFPTFLAGAHSGIECLFGWNTLDEVPKSAEVIEMLNAGGIVLPGTATLPFTASDVGETFTLSIYFCSDVENVELG